jgi:hypothetical protein
MLGRTAGPVRGPGGQRPRSGELVGRHDGVVDADDVPAPAPYIRPDLTGRNGLPASPPTPPTRPGPASHQPVSPPPDQVTRSATGTPAPAEDPASNPEHPWDRPVPQPIRTPDPPAAAPDMGRVLGT